MSQRIADTLEVLDLIRELARLNSDKSAGYWRNKAIAHVASRGVYKRTVYAHLVGKSTIIYTQSARDIDHLINSWIIDKSTDLEKWLLKSCDAEEDKTRISQFISRDQLTPIAVDITEPTSSESTDKGSGLESGILK